MLQSNHKLLTSSWVLMMLGSIGVVGYALVAYTLFPLGDLVHPRMRDVFQEHSLAIQAHIFGSAFALLLGPFQFLSGLRTRAPNLHRWSGRAYLGFGVLIGGLAGLYMAFHAFGGLIGRSGFFFLAAMWLFTGAMAFKAILAGNVHEHRRWMIRNFALTFAAVTLRIQLGLSAASDLSFEQTYPFIAWVCWVPNLLFAEWLIRRFNPKHIGSN